MTATPWMVRGCFELPFKLPVIEVQQYWHRRLQHDPANRWLRGVFHAVNRRDAN